MNRALFSALLAVFVWIVPCATATAQAPGVTAKPLLSTSLSGDEGKVTVLLMVEFAAGAALGRHTHPGDEYATLLEGVLELRADGQEPRRVVAGQAYHNPRGLVHEARNVGDGVARVLATFVVDRGRPVTVPAQ
jgi:quercetin dioxygenase-like cupin family protein